MALAGTAAMNAIERMSENLLADTDLQRKTKKITQGRKIP
jgi:hypothetical protein